LRLEARAGRVDALRWGLIVLGVLASLACASPGAVVAPRPIPGTHVRLALPEGFSVARRFPGLISADTASSVIVTEIPRGLGEVRSGLTEESLTARGMRWHGSEEVTIAGGPGLLVEVSQPIPPNAELRRWVAVFGAADRGVLLTGSTLADSADRTGEVLREVLLTAEWRPDDPIDPYLELGFWVGETESLKISDRLPSMLAFTRGGRSGSIASDEPLYLAGTSFTREPVSNVEDFGHRLLLATAELDDPEVVSSRSFVLDELPAFEIIASARDHDTGEPLRVHQTVIVDGDRYFLLQGLVGTAEADEFMPQFRRISQTFRRTP
jgi:hypothetical protein